VRKSRFVKVKGEKRVGEVRLYALSTCIWCRKAKALLDRSGVEYEYVDVDELDLDDRGETEREVRRLAGKVTFPTMVVDGTVVTGYDEYRLRKVLKLDGRKVRRL